MRIGESKQIDAFFNCFLIIAVEFTSRTIWIFKVNSFSGYVLLVVFEPCCGTQGSTKLL